jgi:hypothetical protein
MVGEVLEVIRLVWTALIEALKLNPRVFQLVEAQAQSGAITLTIALLGGAGLMVGQAVILFVNRVSRTRFALSLLLNGVTYAAGLAFWAVSIWLIWLVFAHERLTLAATLRLVSLGAAPFVFGPLILIPYAGAALGRLLAVWSVLIVVSAVDTLLAGRFWQTAVIVGLGWLLVEVAKGTIGRPIVALHDWLWRRVAGSTLDVRVADVLSGRVDEVRGRPG